MKKIQYILSILLFISAIFTSCDNPSQPEKNEVTVTYYSEYDSQNLPEPLTVEKGYKIKTEDIQPLSDSDNNFVKWETKTGIGIIVGYVVDEDQTFYAKWTPKVSGGDTGNNSDSDAGDNSGDNTDNSNDTNNTDDDNGGNNNDDGNNNGNNNNDDGNNNGNNNSGNQNPPSKDPDTNKVTYSDGSTDETVRVLTADGGYEETVTTKTKAGIVTSVKTIKYTKNADGTETIVTEVPDVGTKRRTYTSSKDINGVWTASSNILKAEPDTTGKGIKFTITKFTNDRGTEYFNWENGYLPRMIEQTTGLRVDIPKTDTKVETENSYVLYYPYVEEGKTYEFELGAGSNGVNPEVHDFIKVTAGKGLGEKNPDFDIEKWNACTVNPEYSASLKRFTVNIQHDVASLLNLITSSNVDTTKCTIELSAVLGDKDWRSTIWRSGTSFTVSGDYASIKDKNIVCNWDTEVTKEELANYGNKFFSGAIFSYTTDIGLFSKEIQSEQMIYKPNTNTDPSKFYVGNWESNYFRFGEYVVHEICEINSDGSYENLRFYQYGLFAGWRGTVEKVDDTTLKFLHNQYKSLSDNDFSSYISDETISFEVVDNNHFIMIHSDGTMSPRMYEREGSAFDVDINDVAGVYKAEEGDLIIKNDGTFECNVDEEVYKGTVEFEKNKFTIEITEPEKYKDEDYGMYVPGIVFVSGYKFIKQSN